jgi:outer membrane protein OmpU
MKKILMGSTALVAATAVTSGAVEAGETSMDISGYNYAAYGMFSRDGANDVANGNDLYTNGEIHFKGSATLDSGLAISYTVQYETEVGGAAIDENYLTFSDSWGSVWVGGKDLPNKQMHVTGAMYTGWMGINTNTITPFVGFSTSYGVTDEFHTAFMNTYGVWGHNDTDHVAYYSPRVSGLQVGIGYAPDNKQNDGAVASQTFSDTVSVGVNFSSDMGGVGVDASAGYVVHGDNGTANVGDDDGLWNFGVQLSSGGFTGGVSYAFTDSTSNSLYSGGGIAESETITAGLKYGTGPYTVGIAYVHGEAEGTTANTGDDEGDRLSLSLAYSLGGGATWDAHAIWSDIEGEDTGDADDVEAIGFITGIGVSF